MCVSRSHKYKPKNQTKELCKCRFDKKFCSKNDDLSISIYHQYISSSTHLSSRILCRKHIQATILYYETLI